MMATGLLTKMAVWHENPVYYELRLGEHSVPLNPMLGQKVLLRHDGEIRCLSCNRGIKKTFRQGYCYPCSQRLAACDICIVKPELCHYEKGTCREPDWGERHCMQPHLVYLANTSAPKVGITRRGQTPTRWIDQGASQALAVLEVQSRHQSGLLEVVFADRVADKTNWRLMLAGRPENIDLPALRNRLLAECGDEIRIIARRFGRASGGILEDAESITIEYPVLDYPSKARALSFDKTANVEGVLLGIKGQYLLLDTGVLNIRKFTSYHISFCTG
jgi:hypothetical protein